MVIAVGSVYYDVFAEFLRHFRTHNAEYVRRLIVYVDWVSRELDKYERAAAEGGFQVVALRREEYSGAGYADTFKNGCCFSLYKSLQHEAVVRMDDDIVFLRSGLFDVFARCLAHHRIVGECYQSRHDGPVLASYMFGVRGLRVQPEDFDYTGKKTALADGCDTYVLDRRHADDVYYFDAEVGKRPDRGDVLSYARTDYYIHIGGVSNDTLPERRHLDE